MKESINVLIEQFIDDELIQEAIEFVELFESEMAHNAEAYRDLVHNMDHNSAMQLVVGYGGHKSALHRLRALSFKAREPVPTAAQKALSMAGKLWRKVKGAHQIKYGAQGNHPNLKFGYQDAVRTHDQQRGHVVHFHGWSAKDNDFMYSVRHHPTGTVKQYPEGKLKAAPKRVK